MLQPASGKKLQVDLVILELVNCSKFCEVFRDLGVPHVISYSMQQNKASNLQSIDPTLKIGQRKRILRQNRILFVNQFINAFNTVLYAMLFLPHVAGYRHAVKDDTSIEDAVVRAREQAAEQLQMEEGDENQLKVIHL